MYDEKSTRRFAVTLDLEDFDRLNKHIGAMRVKVPLFAAIAKQLVKVMENMTPMERRIFIASIIANDVNLRDWLTTKREKEDATTGTKNLSE